MMVIEQKTTTFFREYGSFDERYPLPHEAFSRYRKCFLRPLGDPKIYRPITIRRVKVATLPREVKREGNGKMKNGMSRNGESNWCTDFAQDPSTCERGHPWNRESFVIMLVE